MKKTLLLILSLVAIIILVTNINNTPNNTLPESTPTADIEVSGVITMEDRSGLALDGPAFFTLAVDESITYTIEIPSGFAPPPCSHSNIAFPEQGDRITIRATSRQKTLFPSCHNSDHYLKILSE